jgi:hypothetical protein
MFVTGATHESLQFFILWCRFCCGPHYVSALLFVLGIFNSNQNASNCIWLLVRTSPISPEIIDPFPTLWFPFIDLPCGAT